MKQESLKVNGMTCASCAQAGDEVDTEKARRQKEMRTLWKKFIVSGIFSIPLLYIAMEHLIGLRLPELLVPTNYLFDFVLVQLILTIPIVIAGNKFYTVGFKTLFRGSPNMDSLIAIGTLADVVLMKSDLMDVVTAIQLSKATIRNIKQNLFWVFAYNTAGIPVAVGLLYLFGRPKLNLMSAAAAMSLSSVSVLTNVLILKGFKPAHK